MKATSETSPTLRSATPRPDPPPVDRCRAVPVAAIPRRLRGSLASACSRFGRIFQDGNIRPDTREQPARWKVRTAENQRIHALIADSP